jgi:hypothetical protein
LLAKHFIVTVVISLLKNVPVLAKANNNLTNLNQMEIAEKIYVKTESDLPKEPGTYAVCLKGSGVICGMPFDMYGGGNMSVMANWLLSVDWYYNPINENSKADDELSDPFPDTEADGIEFCGKCGKMK